MIAAQGAAPIRAVVFDVFGTIVEIGTKRWPFAKLARATSNPREALHSVLTTPLGLREAARALGCSDIPLSVVAKDLETELASVSLFPEVAETLNAVLARGLKIGIASNLAAPYAAAVMRVLPFALDAYGWSFEIGFVKPHPAHYRWVCRQLQVAPEETLMIGDALDADFHGARACGLRAVHLARGGRIVTPDIPAVQTLDEILAWL
ncbi:HAD family hydrolase [Ralstonia pseudosolanacearum]|uniref:HAD family hydrolase n=1 Tax=Ralstonia pseudosolanacearum TaxID=1310165 RepID=UPI0022346B39|nr:HAD family hydrolase [Ralstonia sp. RS647]UZF34538.1 HAD family hydrolase [Ralstonia sp. RS647]